MEVLIHRGSKAEVQARRVDVYERTRFGVDLAAGEEPDAWVVGGAGSQGAASVA